MTNLKAIIDSLVKADRILSDMVVGGDNVIRLAAARSELAVVYKSLDALNGGGEYAGNAEKSENKSGKEE